MVTKGHWNLAKDKATIHSGMEKVQSYEEAFAKIQARDRLVISPRYIAERCRREICRRGKSAIHPRLFCVFISAIYIRQTATGISDIDQLVQLFIENEDQNFKMFNYLNELNVEIEKGEEVNLHNETIMNH